MAIRGKENLDGENRIKRKLQEGQRVTVVSGHANTDMIDFLGSLASTASGLSVNMGPLSWEQIGDMSRACDSVGHDFRDPGEQHTTPVTYQAIDPRSWP